MQRFVRASALHGFSAVAREAGADPQRLCEAIGLPAAPCPTPTCGFAAT